MIAITITGVVIPNGKRSLSEIVCACGVQKLVRSDSLKERKFCGTNCSERRRRMVQNRTKHGLSSHRLYQTWLAMVVRCTNPKSVSYSNYGARGIRVCDRWLSVSKFIQDMEPTYSEGLQLDRKDVDGDYCPSNCRWVTPTENARNRRDSYSKRFDAPSNYRELAAQRGINPNTVGYRLKSGLSWDEAVSLPLRRTKQ